MNYFKSLSAITFYIYIYLANILKGAVVTLNNEVQCFFYTVCIGCDKQRLMQRKYNFIFLKASVVWYHVIFPR